MKAFSQAAATLLPFIWIATALMLFDRGDTAAGILACILVWHTAELLMYKRGIFKPDVDGDV